MQDPTMVIERAYDEYSDAIFRHCYLRLSNRDIAKELMQDAFMKAFLYAKKGQQIDNIRALLYRIANNLIVDYVRKAKESSLDALQEAGFDPTGADDKGLADRLDDQRVVREMARLKHDERQVITMRFVDGMKPQEIADILGVSANVISVRIHRALKELRAFLQQA